MKYFHTDFSSYKGFLQGDIFRVVCKGGGAFSEEESYVILITADCDIVNPSKNVEYFTFLPIVSGSSYLDTIWIPIFIEKCKEELSKKLHSILMKNEIHKKFGCNEVTQSDIKEWLSSSSYEEILSQLGLDSELNKHEPEIKMDAITRVQGGVESFRKIREIKGAQSKAILSELKNAVEKPKEEYYLLPMIDGIYDECAIIKLRMIRPIHRKYVHTNEIDARQSEFNTKTNLIRVGRFSDYLRYSISQSFASLFSRIGMPENYEQDCEASLNLFKDMLGANYE